MAVFKCKMCGGALEISENATTAECTYCGTLQTIPRLDSTRKANLYDRANHFRRSNEFDKASAIYELLLAEDGTDAEAYWSLVLCKYGVEYVEDPDTHKRKPTVNRTQPVSVFADENYKSAIGYASQLQKPVYEEEAEAIDKIQKQIMDISSKEEPFDVFICYKETDTDGRRTLDSVLANEMYNQLTQNGLRVFFARITLEDKIGSAYEPYIFSALNSARIMIVLGTKAEYFNAVWVKNEWSRYLAMIKSDTGKVLIPAYSKMDPYDLPEEFSYLQAQDMSRLGFMQDLVRGVKKILLADELNKPPRTDAALSTAVVGDSKIRRIYMFLEDEEWQSADEYCEKVLDIDPECAEAYLGKLMAELKISERAKLSDCPKIFDGYYNYKKAIRFADEKLKAELEGYILQINDRLEKEADEEAWLTRRKAEEKARIALEIAEKEARERAEEEARIAREKAEEEARIARKKAEDEAKIEKEILKTVVISRKRNEPAMGLLSTSYAHTVGLKSDGKVLAMKFTGECYFGQCNVSDWENTVAVSAGYEHTVGLKSDGTVIATKHPSMYYSGQCDVSEWCDITAVSAGSYYTVGLKSDGTVVATKYTGKNYCGQCETSDWHDITAISAGHTHTVGLKSDGTVVAVGRSENGECNVADWRDIIAVSAGKNHTVGLKSNGTVVATKYIGNQKHYHGQCDVSDWRHIVAISAGGTHTVGLMYDGTVVATEYIGDQYYGECEVSGWRDIAVLCAGSHNTVGLKSDGTVVATKYTGYQNDYSVHGEAFGWKLFDNIDTLEDELKVAKAKYEEQKANETERISAERASRRASGVCQYCGGVFKGVFSKKCLSCGIEKDYQ